MKRMRKGFTILELMTVFAVIAILATIVMTASANVRRLARKHQTTTICRCVEQGLETYRAQVKRWPQELENRFSNLSSMSQSNDEGLGGRTNPDIYVLSASEVRNAIIEVIKESVRRKSPMFDYSGLWVSRDPGEDNGHGVGYSFEEAVRKKHWTVSEMYFGYPETNRGLFRRLKMKYMISADAMEVSP